MKKNVQKAAVVVLTGLLSIAVIVGMSSCPTATGPEEEESGITGTQLVKLLGSGGGAYDHFGESVSIDGDYAIVGAYMENNQTGAAYVFVRSGTDWTQQDKLTANDGASNDWFGRSVSIDGDYAIVGAYQDDDGGDASGSAYVFVRSGTDWSQQDKLTADDAAAGDQFGASVCLNGDSAIIGATGDDSIKGSAYVFVRSGTDWSQQDKLTADDGAAADAFGYSVSISGESALVGAHLHNSWSGAAYVFVRSGTDWAQQAKLTASDGTMEDLFGFSVCLNGDYAIVGMCHAGFLGTISGAAYIFERSGTTWSEMARLLPSDLSYPDEFGNSVSLSEDHVIVGAHDSWSTGGPGSAYIFD